MVGAAPGARLVAEWQVGSGRAHWRGNTLFTGGNAVFFLATKSGRLVRMRAADGGLERPAVVA